MLQDNLLKSQSSLRDTPEPRGTELEDSFGISPEIMKPLLNDIETLKENLGTVNSIGKKLDEIKEETEL